MTREHEIDSLGDLEIVIEDPRLEANGLMFSHLDYGAEPQFRVGEVAKCFFGRKSHWLRWLQRETESKPNFLVLKGRLVGNRRSENGTRVYGLRDIEEIAYALADDKRISGLELRNTLLVLDTVGHMWNVRYPLAKALEDGDGWSQETLFAEGEEE